jgi:hypothetical protein
VCAYEVARRGKTLYLTCYFAWYAPPRMRIFASRHLVCVDNYGVHRRQWRTRSSSSALTNVKPGAAGCGNPWDPLDVAIEVGDAVRGDPSAEIPAAPYGLLKRR